MKAKSLILISLFFFSLVCAKSTEVPRLIDHDGNVKEDLLEILEVLKISHDGSLENIVEVTQENWRQHGKERWELEEIYKDKKDKILPLLKNLGCFREISPSEKHYDYAFLHGCLIQPFRVRLAFLIKLWNEGIRFDKLIILTGERYLHEKLEREEILFARENPYLPIRKDWGKPENFPLTETDITKLVYDQADLPEGFKEIETVWISAPPKSILSFIKKRPTTADTILKWLDTNPKPGSCLAISNQPYVGYQDAVFRLYLPENFSLITAGAETSLSSRIELQLDNLARWLYQEKECLKRKEIHASSHHCDCYSNFSTASSWK